MLTLLKIKNLALVDQLLWEPSSGFICITGETGAGKSVIIGAIRLALGERADKTLIRSGEQQCSVEAVFHLPESSPVHAILNEHGVPPCEDGNLIIKRLISSTANRQFLNDSPCTLNLLREAGACLVDMHGPTAPWSPRKGSFPCWTPSGSTLPWCTPIRTPGGNGRMRAGPMMTWNMRKRPPHGK